MTFNADSHKADYCFCAPFHFGEGVFVTPFREFLTILRSNSPVRDYCGHIDCSCGRLLLDAPSILLELLIKFWNSNYEQYKTFTKANEEFDAWFRRTQYQFWEQLDGWAFEHEVARLINKLGNVARTTRGSNDKGVDIVLHDDTTVQRKAHKKPVSPAVVRELYGAMMHFSAPRGILVWLNGFTKGVIEIVRDKPIQLWDVHDLVRMQRQIV